jgi:predicted PurR-regulated permease PerM
LTDHRQLLFWLAALAAFLLFVYIFGPILLPFVAGMAIAYVLDPAVSWLQRRGLSRTVAAGAILAAFVLVVLVALVVLLPILARQASDLIADLPGYAEGLREALTPLIESRLAEFFGVDEQSLRQSFSEFMAGGASGLAGVLTSVLTGGLAVINVLSLVIVTPVVAFYLLIDWNRGLAKIDGWLPRAHTDTIRRLAAEIDRAISGFVRGQGLVCLLLGGFYAIALALIGLEFGLLIGIVAGLLSFIPYVGSAIGFFASVSVATAQFWPDWPWIAATAGIFIFGQFVEGNILQPKLIGGSVGLHPVWLMFALFAFALLFGFVGLLIAVPAAAAVAVLLRFALQQYLAGPYYHGEGGAADEADRQ